MNHLSRGNDSYENDHAVLALRPSPDSLATAVEHTLSLRVCWREPRK